jgi:tyrosyl-tRNA synthetase
MTAKRQFKPVDEQLAYLRKGAAEIIPEPELKAKLEKSFRAGTPLRVYLGVDPTAPDIHLGHTVVLRKLKHFQDLGHTAIFLIGDFSAMIGDPTGRSETRPPLSREEVDANAKTYLAQVFKLLDEEKTEVHRNSDWLDKLSSQEIVRLCGHYRLARMLEREDFRSRLENQQPISVHELLYPLLTAVDAVELKSDVELGATEQKFNLLIHRDIQRAYGLEGQVAFTMPILVGLDGQRKMSKSLDNYVGITETPSEMFGKLMSLSDAMMWPYFDLVTDRTPEEIAALADEVKSGTKHPMDVKMSLAKEIIAGFHGEAAAEKAAAEFQRVFRDREAPDEVQEIKVIYAGGGSVSCSRQDGVIVNQEIFGVSSTGTEKWTRFLYALGQVSSASEAERIVKGRGFEIDGKIISDPSARIDLNQHGTRMLKVGKKKFLRIIVE